MKLFKIGFMDGHRIAYTQARSISEAEARVKKALKDSAYTTDERQIRSVEAIADQTWPGVFGG